MVEALQLIVLLTRRDHVQHVCLKTGRTTTRQMHILRRLFSQRELGVLRCDKNTLLAQSARKFDHIQGLVVRSDNNADT